MLSPIRLLVPLAFIAVGTVTYAGCSGDDSSTSSSGAGGQGASGAASSTGTGAVCTPGATQSCYDGPANTQAVGICTAGTQTCATDGMSWGACIDAVLPAAEEACDTAEDDDCDGTANEADAGCLCAPGAAQSCYDGPMGTEGVGICAPGMQACAADGKSWEACAGAVLPAADDACDTLEDDDCDGMANETDAGCVCAPGATQSCYDGPVGTEGVGICTGGTQTCAADGMSWGTCMGQVLPAAETCSTPLDDDCNGMVNEGGLDCACVPDSVAPCYSGPANTENVGPCKGGMQVCDVQGTSYGPCMGEVVPQPETCNTPIDDNCNGTLNEGGSGCVCPPNAMVPCYSGPTGTQGVGNCKAGLALCNDQGTLLGSCMGEVLPQPETCNTPVDDDCDNQTNESGAGCVCLPNTVASCYTGPMGTQNVGICKPGLMACNMLGTAYGPCLGEVLPDPMDSCATTADDNCNGTINEGCPAVTYSVDVQPILQVKCAPCHTTGGSGGANLASSYAATQLLSYYCSGLTKGACTLVRVQNGSMPYGKGCTGNPVLDAGNPACLTAAEQATLQLWITGGQLP
jgi:hypothetical protein